MKIEVTVSKEDLEEYVKGWFDSSYNLKIISKVKPIKVIVELK